jgi:hypothetical protein
MKASNKKKSKVVIPSLFLAVFLGVLTCQGVIAAASDSPPDKLAVQDIIGMDEN